MLGPWPGEVGACQTRARRRGEEARLGLDRECCLIRQSAEEKLRIGPGLCEPDLGKPSLSVGLGTA